MLQGEIEVHRLMEYYRRSQRALEWIALKEYWRADEEGKEVVRALYGKA